MPGQASATLSRTKLDQWCPPAADLTPWTKSSIWQRPRKSHMSKTSSHSSSSNSSRNTSRNSLRTRHPKAANEATGHPSLSQPTTKGANPANQDETNTANQVANDNPSATTLISVWNTRVFRTALTALTEPRTLWRRITRYPSRCIRTSFTLWWRIRIIQMTRVLHSSPGLQFCWRRLHNAWRLTTSLGAPGSAGDMSGSTSNHSHVFSLYSHLCIYVSI